ncbi:MAG: hypothetical protein WBA13_04275 [Microcoleaceae cyanobacterium]
MSSSLSHWDWETTLKQDCFEMLNQPIEKQQKKPTSGIAIISVLMGLIAFSATTVYQFPRLFESYQQVGQNISTEVFTFMRY